MNNLKRKLLLMGMILALFSLDAIQIPATFHPIQDYDSMSEELLQVELNKIFAKIKAIGDQYWAQEQAIFSKKNSRFIVRGTEIDGKILGRTRNIEALQISINRIEARAIVAARELTAAQKKAISDLELKIKSHKRVIEILGKARETLNKSKRQFELSTWKQVKSLRAAHEQQVKPFRDIKKQIEKVTERRFPDFNRFRPKRDRTPTQANEMARIREPSATVWIPDDVFMKDLLSPFEPHKAYKFPTEFWRAGLFEYKDFNVRPTGERYLNFFRDYSEAKDFMDRGRGPENARLYRIDTKDLVQTREGRAFLTAVRDKLLLDINTVEFEMKIPSQEAYVEAVLKQAKPKPPLLETELAQVERPSKSNFKIEETGKTPRELQTLKTANQASKEILLIESPELLANDSPEWLKNAEEIRPQAKRIYSEQGSTEIQEALENEPSESLVEESRKNMRRVIEEHAPKAAEATAESRMRFFNRLPAPLQRQISRARDLVQWYQRTRAQGLANLNEVNAPWHSKGLTRFFIAVFVWDIAKAMYNGDVFGVMIPAASFVVITRIIPLIAAKSVMIATGLELAMTVLFFWEIWHRFQDFLSDVREFIDAEFFLGDMAWQPRWDPSGRLDYEIATNSRRGPVQIGFLKFKGSPAYGMSRDNWFLNFRSEEDLLDAIEVYEDNLASFFGDYNKIPTKFNYVENHKHIINIIRGEWVEKHKEIHDAAIEEWGEIRAAQLEREKDLLYKVSEKEDLVPEATLLSVKLEPELPSQRDRQVKVKYAYSVTALPGDELEATIKTELINKTNPMQSESDSKKDAIVFDVGEGFKVGVGEKTFNIPGPGDYEVVLNISLSPNGEAPPPESKLFWIEDSGVLDNGWYVIRFEMVYERRMPGEVNPVRVRKEWYVPKKARAGMTKDELLKQVKVELNKTMAQIGTKDGTASIFSGPFATIPRNLPEATETIIGRLPLLWPNLALGGI
ncbi:hypothetical protein ACFLT9_01970 [Acidobacteriota bacterium]